MNKKKISIVAIVALLLCVVGGAAALYVGTTGNAGANNSDAAPSKIFELIYDDKAAEGDWDQKSEEDIQAELNSKVAEGMINMSMNTTPYFVNGEVAGNLMIVNKDINLYPQVVQIILKDTGELIYSSNLIPVGNEIEYDTLDVVLPSGVYDCVAMFYSVDPETGEQRGCSGIGIKITVKD